MYVEDNYIHDLETGNYDNLFCYKVGNSSSATVYLTGNICDVDSSAEEAQGGADGIHQTNGGMFNIVSRGNVYHVSRYVFDIDEPRGSYDEDCMWSTGANRFVNWGGTQYHNLSEFQSATGQEMNGEETPNCGEPPPPTPTTSPTRTPSPTPAVSPTRTPTPSPTQPPIYPPGPAPTAAAGAPAPEESPFISAAMAPGWNYECYVAGARPTDEALATAAGRVSAAYRLGDSGAFDRWFPELPEVSTLTTVSPGDALFLLTSDPFLWTQMTPDTEPTVDLSPGWNSVCYSGESGTIQSATAGIDSPYAAIYSLAADHTWRRYMPEKPEVSTLEELQGYTPVLILVTGGSGRWAFSP